MSRENTETVRACIIDSKGDVEEFEDGPTECKGIYQWPINRDSKVDLQAIYQQINQEPDDVEIVLTKEDFLEILQSVTLEELDHEFKEESICNDTDPKKKSPPAFPERNWHKEFRECGCFK